MSDSGWIKLYRKTLKSSMVMSDSGHLALWIYLLLNAAYTETETVFNGVKIILKPGQLLTSRSTIAKDLHLNDSTIRRLLDDLVSDSLIIKQRFSKYSLISIKKWGRYQAAEQFDSQQNDLIFVQSSSNISQQSPFNINIKNNKEIFKETKNAADGGFEQFWKAYPAGHRGGKAKALEAFTNVEVPLEELLKSLELHKKSVLWAKEKGRFIPNLSNWLDEGRWEDVPEVVETDKSSEIPADALPEIKSPGKEKK